MNLLWYKLKIKEGQEVASVENENSAIINTLKINQNKPINEFEQLNKLHKELKSKLNKMKIMTEGKISNKQSMLNKSPNNLTSLLETAKHYNINQLSWIHSQLSLLINNKLPTKNMPSMHRYSYPMTNLYNN